MRSLSSRWTIALASSLTLVGLSGCAVAQDAANQAACAALTPVTDQVSERLDDIVGAIELDPAGSLDQLTSWRSSLEATAQGLPGGIAGSLDQLLSALDEAIAVAERAAEGATVTPQETQDVEDDVRGALAGLVGDCQ